MKRFTYLTACLALMFFSLASAQTDKEDKTAAKKEKGAKKDKAAAKKEKEESKAWKKKLKDMPDAAFLLMVDEYKILQGEEKGLDKQLESLETQTKQLDTDISQKAQELDKLKEQCAANKAAAGASAVKSAGPTGFVDEKQVDYSLGTTYKVQIGSFQNPKLKELLDADSLFSGDVDHDGTRKYTVGYFREYAPADKFKKILLEVGVKDAWIVAYKDNKRVTVEDMLGGGAAANTAYAKDPAVKEGE